MTLTTQEDVMMNDDVITDYAAGNLSPAKHVILACQSEISEAVAERVAFQENIAASMVEDSDGEALSPLFMGNVLAALPPQELATDGPTDDPIDGLAPKSLRHMLGHGLQDMKWKSLVPGIAVHDILGNRKTKDGDRLYLLKAKGGMKMPDHGHNDLHIEDETEIHSPHIDEGEDCICLVMTQGPLEMQGWLPKMVQKVVGI